MKKVYVKPQAEEVRLELLTSVAIIHNMGVNKNDQPSNKCCPGGS